MARFVKLHRSVDNLSAWINGKTYTFKTLDNIEDIVKGAVVYVIGSPQNAELVCILSELVQRSETADQLIVKIATPSKYCALNKELEPNEAFVALERTFGLPPSIGGFRMLSPANDWAIYSIVHRSLDEIIDNKLYKLHPAWAALSFVKTLSLVNGIKLLKSIVDPRWFVDPQTPDRVSKLNAYLGLTNRMMRIIIADTIRPSREEAGQMRSRAEAAVHAWSNSGELLYEQPAELASPKNFLYRYFLRCTLSMDSSMSLLRTTKRFLYFIRQVWLNEVTATHKGHLFIPTYFFSDLSELEGWYINNKPQE